MTTSRFRLLARAEQAALLELPWGVPLEQWPADLVVDVERGIGRHVVQFVRVGDALFALKELPPRLAAREYRLLGTLERQEAPAVEAVGIVDGRHSATAGCSRVARSSSRPRATPASGSRSQRPSRATAASS